MARGGVSALGDSNSYASQQHHIADLRGEPMDLARVRREVDNARRYFAYIEGHPTNDGSLYVLAAFQAGNRFYTVSISFPDNYPNSMPSVVVRKPDLRWDTPHRYREGNICYLHPKMWNPGYHTLTFVMERAAKWLSKYEVWLATQRWPGAEILH